MCEIGIYIKSILTSQQYCGEPGTLTFQCRSGGSAALLAPRSHPVSLPQTGRHVDLNRETQATLERVEEVYAAIEMCFHSLYNDPALKSIS